MQLDPRFVESLLFQESTKHMVASSFFEAIQMILVLERFSNMKFKLHLGTTDPVVHVQYYRRVILLY